MGTSEITIIMHAYKNMTHMDTYMYMYYISVYTCTLLVTVYT